MGFLDTLALEMYNVLLVITGLSRLGHVSGHTGHQRETKEKVKTGK